MIIEAGKGIDEITLAWDCLTIGQQPTVNFNPGLLPQPFMMARGLGKQSVNEQTRGAYK